MVTVGFPGSYVKIQHVNGCACCMKSVSIMMRICPPVLSLKPDTFNVKFLDSDVVTFFFFKFYFYSTKSLHEDLQKADGYVIILASL